MSSITRELSCPFCQTKQDVLQDWIIKNRRVFCETCCKSYEVIIQAKDPMDDFDLENLLSGEEA